MLDTRLSGSNVKKCDLVSTRLEDCAISGVNFKEITLRDSIFKDWKLSGLTLFNCSFTKCKIIDVKFVASNRPFSEWRIERMTIEDMGIEDCKFTNCDFSGATLGFQP